MLAQSKPKVILLVPTINSEDYFELWSDRIYALDPKPDLVVFCENNSWDNTLNLCYNFKLPHEVIRVWMREDIDISIFQEDNEYLNICHVRQLLLTKARMLNPDYAIFVDDDVLPPKNLISEVVKNNKDILGGYYYRNFPEGRWLCSKFYENDEGEKLMYVDDDWIKNMAPKSHPKYVEGDLIRAFVTSGGCLALSRKILHDKRLSFYPRAIDVKTVSEDFGFCVKALELGYTVYVHRFLRCFHLMDRGNFNRPWAVNDKNELVNFGWREDTRPKK